MNRATALAAIALVALPLACGAANVAGIIEQTDNEILFELATDDYSVTEVVHGGESYFRVDAPGLDPAGDVGRPWLPSMGVLLAVPFGADVRLEIISTETERAGSYRIEPTPTEAFTYDVNPGVPGFEDGEPFPTATIDFLPDRSFYEGSDSSPGRVAELGFDSTLRHHRVVQVTLHPFQYSPRANALTVHTRIVARLVLGGWRDSGRADGDRDRVPGFEQARVREPEWDMLYAGTILNHAEAEDWRMRPSPRRGALEGAMRQDHEAYRLKVSETGIHRIDFSDLSSQGLAGTLDIEDVAVYQRSFEYEEENPFVETPMPVLVFDENTNDLFDGGDYVLFYAQSFEDQHMPVGYEDRYGTENVYWFGWGDGLAARMTTRDAWHGWTGLTPPVSFRDTVRFEEDVYLDVEPPNQKVDWYTWTFWDDNNDDWELPFELHDIDASADLGARVRYQGNLDSGHTMTMSIIDGLSAEHTIGIHTFYGSSDSMNYYIYSNQSLSSSYFTDGANTFHSVGANGRSGADLDWFEFSYNRLYEAHEGRLSFANGGETGDSEFEIGSFTSSDIVAFDVTDPLAPVALTLDAQSVTGAGGDYTLTLQDAPASFTRYEALGETAALTVDSVERREPANLFSSEADVIVVSNERFDGTIDELVDYRRAQGHLIADALLGEVYDEFNGGLPGPEGIKNYFRYAWEQWDRQPQFGLLVGDGSEDTRGVLSSSGPNLMPTYIESQANNAELIGSDSYYVSFDDQDPYLPSMYIGRMPAGPTTQLETEIAKIKLYETYDPSDSWRNRFMFVGDDVWSYGNDINFYTRKETSEGKFTSESITMGETVSASPAVIDTSMFMLRRHTDPLHGDATQDDFFESFFHVRDNVTPELIDEISDGVLLVNFQGHANRAILTHEGLLYDNDSAFYYDIDELNNEDMPFIFFGFACSIAEYFHYNEGNGYECLPEQMLHLADNKGAVACFASTGLEYLTPNITYNKKIMEAMFTDETPAGSPDEYFWPRWSLGGILGKAAVKYVTSTGSGIAARRFVLLGDPLLHIETSPPSIQLTVDGVPYVSGDFLEAAGEDPITIVADIIDEVEIDPTSIVLEESDIGAIDPELYTVEAITDTAGQQSRWYRLTYTTTVRDWSYDIKLRATDTNGVTTRFVLHIAEGSRILIRDVANHPNPFDHSTRIIYLLNQSGADVSISIYTVGGRRIRVLEDAPGDLNYNEIEWDGTDDEGDRVANGLYLYVIEVRGEDDTSATSDVGRMVKMR